MACCSCSRHLHPCMPSRKLCSWSCACPCKGLYKCLCTDKKEGGGLKQSCMTRWLQQAASSDLQPQPRLPTYARTDHAAKKRQVVCSAQRSPAAVALPMVRKGNRQHIPPTTSMCCRLDQDGVMHAVHDMVWHQPCPKFYPQSSTPRPTSPRLICLLIPSVSKNQPCRVICSALPPGPVPK